MPRNVYCDQCEKYMGDNSLAYFSDIEQDLDFCSEECYSQWKKKSNAQKWLGANYPDKENTYNIYINEQLEGVLDCSEYKKLEIIYLSTQIDSSKFEIIKRGFL